jgi:gp16 family phage-associated protein
MSISEFARANGLTRMAVADILRGKTIGRWGAAHNAAVLLGLKRGVVRPIEKGAR